MKRKMRFLVALAMAGTIAVGTVGFESASASTNWVYQTRYTAQAGPYHSHEQFRMCLKYRYTCGPWQWLNTGG